VSYKYARVFLSGVNYAVDFGRTSIYRINVVNKNGVLFDDDGCCVWTSTSSNPKYLGAIEVTYGLPEKIFLIETYISDDGNSWYRKYSDGWIEQGGKALSGNTYVFPIPFTSVPTFTHGEYNDGESNSHAVGFCQLTTSGFTLQRYTGGNIEMHWRACGY
jgi:hypothetical protein